IGWALLATAAGGVLPAVRARGLAVRITAWTAAGSSWGAGLLIGVGQSLRANGASDAAGPGALLLAAAVVALAFGWRATREAAVTGGAVAGLAAVAGVGGVLRTEVTWSWAVLAYLLCAAALVPVSRIKAVPRPVRTGLLGTSAAVTGVSVLAVLPAASVAVVAPFPVVTGVWSGAPRGVRDVAGAAGAWPDAVSVPVVLLVVAVLLAAAYASLVQAGRPRTGWPTV
ncbi:hypothetical protein G3M53_21580, partial [Streptomyces sp. SID7982]|nr:hypothetical protein [Streptomyces sp. SID7982]